MEINFDNSIRLIVWALCLKTMPGYFPHTTTQTGGGCQREPTRVIQMIWTVQMKK